VPTVLAWKGFRFYFFSNEGSEPAHIHVDKADATAKLWLSDGSLARNIGFKSSEVTLISDKVRQEQDRFLEAWRGHFGS
jgi:hypothetical protein